MQQFATRVEPHRKQPAARPWRVTLLEGVLLITLAAIVLAFLVHLFYEIENYWDHTTCSDFSPTCDRIAVGRRRSMEVYDTATGEMICHAAGETLCVKFSPDGKYVATGDTGSIAELWDAVTGERVRTIGQVSHVANVPSFEFSPTGEQMFIACGDQISICSTSDGSVLRTFEVDSPIREIFVSQNGAKLAAFSWDRVFVVETATDKMITLPIDPARFIDSAKYIEVRGNLLFTKNNEWLWDQISPSGRYVAGASKVDPSWSVDLLDRQEGSVAKGLFDHPVTTLQFSQDERFLYAYSEYEHVSSWDIKKGRESPTVWLQTTHEGSYPLGAIFLSALWAVTWWIVARRSYDQDQSSAGLRGYAAVLIAALSYALSATLATMRFFPSRSFSIGQAAYPERTFLLLLILLSIGIGVILSFSAIRRKTLLCLISLMLLLLSSALVFLFAPRY